MLKLDLRKWPADDSLTAFMFVVQSIEELLFDGTFDHYRYTIINSHILCKILNDELGSSKGRRRNVAVVESVKDVLQLQLEEDCENGILISDNFREYIRQLINFENGNIKDLQDVTFGLLQDLEKYYYDGILTALHGLISENSQEYGKLRLLSNAFVSELIFRGYSQKYVYSMTKNLFFPKEGKGGEYYSSTTFDHYLRDFPFIEHTFDLRLFTSLNYDELMKLDLKQHDIEVTDASSLLFDVEIPEDLKKILREGGYSSLTLKNVKAFDQFSAYDLARNLIELIGSIQFMRHHKVPRISISPFAIAKDENGNRFRTGQSVDVILRRPDTTIDKDSYRYLSEHLLKFDDLNVNSKQRIFHILISHKNAIITESPQSKLIALWSTLEQLVGILPPEDNVMESVKSNILPLLTNGYPKILLNDLINNLKLFAGIENRHLSTVGNPEVEIDILALAFALGKEPLEFPFAPVKDYHGNPLLLYRIKQLGCILKATENISSFMEEKTEEMILQFRLANFERNLILHRGRNSNNLEPLITFLHTVVDRVLRSLIKTLKENEEFTSLEQSFEYLKCHSKSYLDELKNAKGVTVDETNYKKYILEEIK